MSGVWSAIHVSRSFVRPNIEEPAEENELAEVVGIVVDEEDGFVGQGLIVGVGDGGEEVGLFEGGDKFLAVRAEGGDGFVPGFGVGRLWGFGPVARGPIGRLVFRVEGVLDDVPLGEAKVLGELIGGVRDVVGALAAKLGGEIFDGVIEARVSVGFGQMRDELLAKCVGIFRWFWWHGGVVSPWWSRLP